MWLQPFARTNVFLIKNICFVFWARIDTKLLNLSHYFKSMDGWPGDAIFFLLGQPLEIIRMYSAKKRSSPLEFIFDTCASASSSHLFWLVKLNICGCSLLLGQIYFQQKKHVFCILSAHRHKILEFVPPFPIYGWLAW